MSLSFLGVCRWLGRLLYRGLLLHCWLLLVLYLGFKFAERQLSIAALPLSIEPSGVVLIGGESGLREGCGVAVFRMSGSFRQRLMTQGQATLELAQQGRGYIDDPYYSYSPWLPTPVEKAAAEVALGLGCSDADDVLARRIYRALESPGAFYSRKPEGMLLVVPQEGLIVFGHFG
ncbi:MAG TPA: hypothetical protein VLC30_09550 [Pseudomonas sp.]|nr:hypothetical protein [Pseudomonas sp.]